MQLLASPIVWLILAVIFLFRKPSGTDLDIFANAGNTTTSNGTHLTGLTINKAKAKTISSSLLEEFNKWFTDEAQVIFLLHSLNEKDFMLVYDQFGLVRKGITGNDEAVLPFGDKLDLIVWINNNVTTTVNKNKLNKQFPNIF